MTRHVHVEPEASAELEDAALWYERQRAGLGADLTLAVDEALTLLEQWPRLGHPIPQLRADIPARLVPVQRFPYTVVYMEWHNAIRVLAIAHERRAPGYWLTRV